MTNEEKLRDGIKNMTADTERAMAVIKPLADELKYNVDADENLLYVNGIGIGIACNSTYATVMEFIGYIFLVEFCNNFRLVRLSDSQREVIKRYWFSPEQLEKMFQSMIKTYFENGGDNA